VDGLIEHFRDKDRRKEFFKEYKEIEMLYEIISPDAYLRPFIADYTTLSRIYDVVTQGLHQAGVCGPGFPEEDE
jgi:type I restriction enzyme, R subunit